MSSRVSTRKPAGLKSTWLTSLADSESESVSKNHDGWKRGIRIGKIADGRVAAFIPDPAEKATTTSSAEGVAADKSGNIFGAEAGSRRLVKYVKN